MRIVMVLALLVGTGSATMAEDFPVPPMPPVIPQIADAAPVPNPDAAAPVTPSSEEPSVNVRMYRARTYDPSVGFAPGSHYESTEDRKPIQTPGFSISVPLK